MVSFILISLPPGDYLTALIAQRELEGDTTSRDYIEDLREYYGLDQPSYVQYWKWVSRFVTGDFGISFEYNKPVSEIIGDRLALTMVLSISSLFLTWLIGIPIGIYSATHQYSLGDSIFTGIAFVGMATPGFLLALVILVFMLFQFDINLIGLFSPEYADASWSFGKVLDLLKHLWVPALLVSISGTGGIVRIMRGNLLDILGQQYVLTARSKGLKERTVVYKHAVRIAINPLISIAGMSLPRIIGGSVLVAIVMNLPTTGPLFIRALQMQDMYLAGTFIMFLALFLIIGNFFADIALAFADPRIRYD